MVDGFGDYVIGFGFGWLDDDVVSFGDGDL